MSVKTKFTYYPGCSSQGAGIHLDRSLHAIASRLDFELETIEDWNCCGASVGHVKGGQLAQWSLSGRNLALARQQSAADIVSPCAACYLNTHFVNEKMKNDAEGARQHQRGAGGGRAQLSGRPQGAAYLRGAGQRCRHRKHQGSGDEPAAWPQGRGLGRLPDRPAVRGQGERRAVHHLRSARPSSTSSPRLAAPSPCPTIRRAPRAAAARCRSTAPRRRCT